MDQTWLILLLFAPALLATSWLLLHPEIAAAWYLRPYPQEPEWLREHYVAEEAALTRYVHTIARVGFLVTFTAFLCTLLW